MTWLRQAWTSGELGGASQIRARYLRLAASDNAELTSRYVCTVSMAVSPKSRAQRGQRLNSGESFQSDLAGNTGV